MIIHSQRKRESKASLSPVRVFIPRVFRDMKHFGTLAAIKCRSGCQTNPTEWICRTSPDGCGSSVRSKRRSFVHLDLFDIFRVQDGKIAEHWDNATNAGPPASGKN
jgi:hypothetical protein